MLMWSESPVGDTDDLKDGIITTQDGGVFRVHIGIVRYISKCLRHLFDVADETEAGKKLILVPEVSKNLMKLMLDHIYGRNIPINPDNVEEILLTANYFELYHLKEKCEEVLLKNVNFKTCVDFFILAKKTFCENLKVKAFECLKSQFDKVISENVCITELDIDSLINLLKADDLVVSREEVVWKAIVKWVETKPQELTKVSRGEHQHLRSKKPHVYALLTCLRLNRLEEKYITQEILEHPIVKRNDHCIKRQSDAMLPMEGCLGDSVNAGNPILHLTEKFGLTCRTLSPRIWNVAYVFIPKIQAGENVSEIFMSSDLFSNKKLKIGEIDKFRPGTMILDEEKLFLFDVHFVSIFSFNLVTSFLMELEKPKQRGPDFDLIKVQKTILISSGISPFHVNPGRPIIDCYNIVRDRWSVTSTSPSFSWQKSAILKRVIYVVGCHQSSSSKVLHLMCKSIGTDSWMRMAEPRSFRFGFAFVAFDGYLYIIGGNRGMKEVERYNPMTNTWENFKALPRQIIFPKAVVLGETLIVCEKCERHNIRVPFMMFLEPGNKDWNYVESHEVSSKVTNSIIVQITDPSIIHLVLNRVQ